MGSFSPAANVWSVGALAVNASAQISLLVNVGSGVPPGTLIVNTAMVTSTTVPIPPPNAVVTTPVIGVADLSVVKDDGLTFVNVNQVITYTIVVRNLGPSDATGARVADTLPAGLVSAAWTCSPAAGAACFPTSGSGSISATVNLAAGSRVTFTMVAVVGPCDTNILVNTATVTPPGNVTDPNPVNNTATDTDAIGPGANLVLTKKVSSVGVAVGSPLVYVIVATNYGPDPAASTKVVENLPPSLSFVSSAASSGAFSASTGLWMIGTIAVGQSVTLTVNTTVGAVPNGTEINNVATLLTSTPGNAPLGALATAFVGHFVYAYLPVALRPDFVSPTCPCQ